MKFKIKQWHSRTQAHKQTHSFMTLSQKVTISRHGSGALLQTRQPAACQLVCVKQQAASFFHQGPQRLRSSFITRKFRFCHWETHWSSHWPPTNHLLITTPCPFNTRKTSCIFTCMLLQYICESMSYSYQCTCINEFHDQAPKISSGGKQKWKKGMLIQ